MKQLKTTSEKDYLRNICGIHSVFQDLSDKLRIHSNFLFLIWKKIKPSG